MADKEKSELIAKMEREVLAGESKVEGEDLGGMKFLEQLMIFLKLKLLRQTSQTGNVKKETIDSLQEDLLGNNKEKKEKASLSLDALIKKIVGVETGLDEQTMGSLIKKANMPGEQAVHADRLEERVKKLKTREYAGDVKKEAEEITNGFMVIGEKVGILKPGEKGKELIVEKLNAELSEVSEIKRRVQIIKLESDIENSNDPKSKRNKTVSETKSFVKKELSQNDRATKVRSKSLPESQRNDLQAEIDKLLNSVNEDLEGKSALSHEEILDRLYQINKLARKAGKMERPGEVTDRFLEMQFIYSNEFMNILRGSETLTSQGEEEIYRVLKELWYDKKFPSQNEFKAKLNGALKTKGILKKDVEQEVGKKSADDLHNTQEDPLKYIEEFLGLDQHSKRVHDRMQIESMMKVLAENKLDLEDIYSLSRGSSEQEFVRNMKNRFGFEESQSKLFFESITNNRAAMQKAELEHFVTDRDYKGYTFALIAYLSRVGLREGMNDLELMSLMNNARLTLAEAGPEGEKLLEIFKSFEGLAFFHDKYFNIGAKEYAEILGHIGNNPLWVWMEEYADVMKHEITFTEGIKNREKADVSVAGIHDMMQSQYWAKRLIYCAPIREDNLFKEMMVSHMMNGDEPINWDLETGKVTDLISGRLLGNTKDMISIDGSKKSMSLDVYIGDAKWMASTAQDIWRLTGRNLNILDDVRIGGALNVNKGLLGISRICRYGEEYEFVSSYQHEIMGADQFLYDFDWYKNTVGKGLAKIFREAGVDEKSANDMQILFMKHITRKRAVGEEVFDGSNLAIEDLRLLANGTKQMTFEEAKKEYTKRLAKRGEDLSKINIDESSNSGYSQQVKLLMEMWNDNAFSGEDMAAINALPWDKINQMYAKKIGKDAIGSGFSGFMNNFSYSRIASYVENIRGTDMKDYGGYYVTSAEAVAGAFKAGLANGTYEAFVKMIGAMETYHPYDKNGLNRLAMAMWKEILTWRTHQYSRKVPKQSAGYKLPNGDFVVNKYGRWEKEMKTEIFLPGDSLMRRYKYLYTWNFEDAEMYMRGMIGQGILTRKDGDALLAKKYGPKVWRWIRRAVTLNDWEYLWINLEKEGGKELSNVFKYIFSAK